MKEELQSKLVEILGSIQAAAGKAGDFAMVQLPDIAQSYVVYGRMYHSLTLLMLVAAIALSAFLLWKGYSRQDSEEGFFCLLGGGIGLFFAMAAMFIEDILSSALLVWFAPKVWLLKEIAGLVK